MIDIKCLSYNDIFQKLGSLVQNIPKWVNPQVWIFYERNAIIWFVQEVGWLVVGLIPTVTRGIWDYRWNAHCGGGVFLRDPKPYLREFRRKTTKNSERLGWEARPEIKPGTSRPPVFRAEPLSHWWSLHRRNKTA